MNSHLRAIVGASDPSSGRSRPHARYDRSVTFLARLDGDWERLIAGVPELPKPNELRKMSEAWAPHRTVASWYLWRIPRSRENKAIHD